MGETKVPNSTFGVNTPELVQAPLTTTCHVPQAELARQNRLTVPTLVARTPGERYSERALTCDNDSAQRREIQCNLNI